MKHNSMSYCVNTLFSFLKERKINLMKVKKKTKSVLFYYKKIKYAVY